jgi:heat shock protein HslJ
LNGTYSVLSIEDKNVIDRGLTINFDTSTLAVSGSSGCNNYFGSFQKENKEITFSKVGATKKFCRDSEVRKIEEQFLALLPKIKSLDNAKSENFNFYDDASQLLLSIQSLKK